MKTESVKKIPYGITDYELIRQENYYYVDKTRYLSVIDDAGLYLFYVRPKRFGKSQFLSMMECYYDVNYKDRFEELFNDTWIYDNPTRDRGSYLILKFNFSLTKPEINKLAASFLLLVKNAAHSFVKKYEKRLLDFYTLEKIKERIDEARSPSDVLSFLVHLANMSDQKVYVLIDEYDRFARPLLSTRGKDEKEELERVASCIHSFFTVLKAGTSGTGSPLSRLFITGVSSVMVNHYGGGFNIGLYVSNNFDFNSLSGFTHEEVIDLLEYYREKGFIRHGKTIIYWK